MGDSPVFNTIKNVAGYGVGTLAALDTIKGGGLGSYLMNRQRLMSDPGFRSTLAGSPFAAGVFGVSGATGPAPAAPTYPQAATGGVAQPGDGVGPPAGGGQLAAPGDAAFAPLPAPTAQNVPGYIPGTPRAWMPNLPPYDPEEAIKQQAIASQQIAIGAPDSFLSGIAKMQAGIMPTPKETETVLGHAKDIQRAAGMGSTVGVKLPGMTVQIGSPYNIAPLGEEEFATPEQARAAASAHGPGWSIGPTVHGGWRPIPPPTNEQMMPPAPGTGSPLPGGATGPVLQGGGAQKPLPVPGPQASRVDPYHAAFTNAADANGLPHGLLNSMAEHESSFNPAAQGPVLPAGDRAQGLMQFRPATAQRFGVDPTDPISSIGGAARYMRGLVDQNQGNVAAALQQYGGGPHYPVASILARADQYRGTIDQPPAAQAAAPPPPIAPVERGAAYAAEPPPGAKVMSTPAPVPVPTFDPAETVPHVVVPAGDGGAIGYPPPAPTAPGTIRATPYPVIRAPVVPAAAPAPGSADALATMPPPMAPVGIYGDPSTKEPLKTISQTYQGGRTETYGAPDLGDYNTQVKARLAGIVDPRTASFDSLVNSLAQDRALHAQTEIDNATIARTKRAMNEGESKEFKRLDALKTNLDNFLTKYGDPAERDKFVGPAVDWRTMRAKLNWPGSEAFNNFSTAAAPLTVGNFTDEKGHALPGMEDLAPVAPSLSDTPSEFNAHLQAFQDALDLKIWQDNLIRATPLDKLTPDYVSAQRDAFLRDRTAVRMAAILPDAPPTAAPAAPPADTTPPPAASAPEAPAAPEPWAPAWVH